MLAGTYLYLDNFELGGLDARFRILLFLTLGILEFTIIHDFRNRRHCVGRNFNKIKVATPGFLQGFGKCDYAEIRAVFGDDAQLGRLYLMIDSSARDCQGSKGKHSTKQNYPQLDKNGGKMGKDIKYSTLCICIDEVYYVKLSVSSMKAFLMRKRMVVFWVVALSFVAITYTAYAYVAVNKAGGNHVGKIDSASAVKSLQKMLDMRIAEYQAFASTSLPSISKADRAVLSAEIEGSIARMKATLAASSSPVMKLTSTNASSTKYLSFVRNLQNKSAENSAREDTLLSLKMGVLMLAFHPAYGEQISNKLATSSPFLLTPLSATSTVSADIIHSIIIATSTNDIISLQKEVSGLVIDSQKNYEKAHPRDYSKTRRVTKLGVKRKQKAVTSLVSTTTEETATSTESEPMATSTVATTTTFATATTTDM